MLQRKLYLQHTIDVYVAELAEGKFKLTFHRMTTRERIEIITSRAVAEFLALLNGKNSVEEILKKLGTFDELEAKNFIDFLTSHHLVTDQDSDAYSHSKYERQIAYFDDMILDRKGIETQELLGTKTVTLLGCGAVNGYIAELLARAGVKKFTLVDYKVFDIQNISRHIYSKATDIGKSKVEILSKYLTDIDSEIKVDFYQEKLTPNSDLSKWVPERESLVINGCDEPYIGHTSLKIGRYLQDKNIPLYVSGGFDAHLMSSGELVFPPLTPCIDCIQSTFSKALGEWKPTYSQLKDSSALIKIDPTIVEEFPVLNIGGAGGLASMSSFSASLSSMEIIQFLVEDSNLIFNSLRYEYLPNKGEMTGFELLKQDDCHVCNG